LLFLAGCVTAPPAQPVVRLTGDPVLDDQARLAAAPDRDRVLWEYKVAAAALRRGQLDEARAQLDAALKSADGILGTTGPGTQAAAARGLFHQEAGKPFVGESYERIMAGFYRGILYWHDGEPDNARALFRNGGFLAGGTGDNVPQGGWVLLDYLDGLATTKLHGDGSDSLARARARSAHPLPGYDPAANVLVFVEYGAGPLKYATGQYREQLKYYSPELPAVTNARLTVAGQTLDLAPWDDVGAQATMRGGRVMDQILGNKAGFKQATDLAGDVLLAGGAAVAVAGKGRRSGEAAIGLLAAGVTSKIASLATQPAADTRTWDNLPRYLSFAALRLPPGAYPATLTFYDPTGRALPGPQDFSITVPAPTPGSAATPPPDTVIFRSGLAN
jgi:tetratricopeptide (TPR) repeat protein